jgi:hypothetical protein
MHVYQEQEDRIQIQQITVCQLTPDLSKVRTFASHFLKDVRTLSMRWLDFLPIRNLPKVKPVLVVVFKISHF